MKRFLTGFGLALSLLVLSACGPVRKSVFPPLVSVQQLHRTAGGQWQMQLRIQNNSYTGVKFTGADLAMQVHGVAAGHIRTTLNLDIPALSVDIADVTLTPARDAQKALADAGNSAPYTLQGTVTGAPDDETKPHTFKVHGKDWLSPVPGIPDTWR